MKEPVPVCVQSRCQFRVSADSEIPGQAIASHGLLGKTAYIKCTHPCGICTARKIQVARQRGSNGKIQE